MHFSKFVCVHAQINWEFLRFHEGGLTRLHGEQMGFVSHGQGCFQVERSTYNIDNYYNNPYKMTYKYI